MCHSPRSLHSMIIPLQLNTPTVKIEHSDRRKLNTFFRINWTHSPLRLYIDIDNKSWYNGITFTDKEDRATLESDPSALSGFMSRVMPQVSLFFVSRFVDVKVITLLRKFKALNSGFGQSPMRRRRHYSYLFCNPVSFLIDSLNSQDPQKSSSCWYHGCEVWVSQGNWSLCWPPVTM